MQRNNVRTGKFLGLLYLEIVHSRATHMQRRMLNQTIQPLLVTTFNVLNGSHAA
jgi:hypothetical protein